MENENIVPEMENETSEVAETVETKEAVTVEAETPEATETVAEEAPEIQEEKPAGYCTKCGTPYKEGQLFCANCGTPLNASVPAQPVAAAPSAPVTPPVPGQYIVQQPVAAKPKKKNKSTAIIAIIAAVVICFVSIISVFSVKEKDVVGTWAGTYTYNGNTFSVAFTLNDNGTYTKMTLKNGKINSFEKGDWEAKGFSVILYDSSAITYHGESTKYSYIFGQLENNNHYFSRSEKN